MYASRQAIIEIIETHLIDKATDTATIIDGRINVMIQLLDGIASMPVLTDVQIPYSKKSKELDVAKERFQGLFNGAIQYRYINDTNGTYYASNGTTLQIQDRQWFQETVKGKPFISEPLISRTTNKLIIVLAIPVYDNNKSIIGVLVADIDGLWLSSQVEDIIVGKTGYCYVLGLDGTDIADPDHENSSFKVEFARKSKNR